MTKKKREFYVLLKDTKRSRFATKGPMDLRLMDDWYAAAELNNLLALDVLPDDVQVERGFLIENGWVEIEASDLVDEPIDRSNHYLGPLPAYAARADRSKAVSILCRECRKIRWAVLTKPYPGPEALKAAAMFDYRAICLKCGYRASDNYNWSR